MDSDDESTDDDDDDDEGHLERVEGEIDDKRKSRKSFAKVQY